MSMDDSQKGGAECQLGIEPGSAKLKTGERCRISLPVQLGWGGRWVLAKAAPEIVELIKEKIETGKPPPSDGNTELQVMIFQAKAPGQAALTFEERRPFAPDEPPRRSITHHLIVENN